MTYVKFKSASFLTCLALMIFCKSCTTDRTDYFMESFKKAMSLKNNPDSIGIAVNYLEEIIVESGENEISKADLIICYESIIEIYRTQLKNQTIINFVDDFMIKFKDVNVPKVKSKFLHLASDACFYTYEYEKANNYIDESIYFLLEVEDYKLHDYLGLLSEKYIILCQDEKEDLAKLVYNTYEDKISSDSILSINLSLLNGYRTYFRLEPAKSRNYFEHYLKNSKLNNINDSINQFRTYYYLADNYVSLEDYESAINCISKGKMLYNLIYGDSKIKTIRGLVLLQLEAHLNLEFAISKKDVQLISSVLEKVKIINEHLIKNISVFDYDYLLENRETLYQLAELEIKALYFIYKITGNSEFKVKLISSIQKWKDYQVMPELNTDIDVQYLKQLEYLKQKLAEDYSVEANRELLRLYSNAINSKWNNSEEIIVDTLDLIDKCKTSKTQVFDYYIGHNNFSLLTIFNGKEVTLKELPFDSVNSISREFIEKMTSDESFQYTDISKKLFEIFIGDVDQDVENLVFIPYSFLEKLPFSILVNPEHDGSEIKFSDHIFYNYLTSNKYSLDHFSKSIENSIDLSDSKDISILGYSFTNKSTLAKVNQNKLGELIGTLLEVNSIENNYKEAECTIMTGLDATKNHFLKTSEDPEILHLSLHGSSNNESRLENKIYFRGIDNLLSPYELIGMNFNAKLISLSACETGSGKVYGNYGMMSFGRAFYHACQGNIITNLWESSDGVSSDFYNYFYSYLSTNGSIELSFQLAIKDYLSNQTDERLKSPYYWANLIVY